MWNILLQVTSFVHYTFLYDQWPLWERTISLVWIMQLGMVCLIVLVDLEIFQVFGSIIPSATPKNIGYLRIGLIIIWLLSCTIPFVKACSGLWTEHWALEQLCGILFIVLCMIYDNAQSAYLIYSLNKKLKNRRANLSAWEKSLRKTVLWNAVIVSIDWLALGVISYQISLPTSATKFAIQQSASGLTGIHANGIIVLFQNLKKLTFAGQKPKAKQEIPCQVDQTEMEINTKTLLNRS
jgi:hypothetical protein